MSGGWCDNGGWNSEETAKETRSGQDDNQSTSGGWGSSGNDNDGSRKRQSRNDSYNDNNSGGWGASSNDNAGSDSGKNSNSGGWGAASNETGMSDGGGFSKNSNSNGWGQGQNNSRSGNNRGRSFGTGRGRQNRNSNFSREETNSGSGGWGQASNEDSNKNSESANSGGWGDSGNSSSNKESQADGGGGGGGWGCEPTNSKRDYSDRNDSPSKKRFRPREENGNQDEERPAPYKPQELNLEEEAQLQEHGVGENFQKYKDQKVTCLPKDQPIQPIKVFEDVVTSKLLLGNIKSQKYSEMTPIQKWAMPAIMEGYDLIGCAQTGSGKTAAFLLPVLETLLKTELEPSDPNSDCQNPYCLIISPTRELANQIYVHANMLSRDSLIKCHVIYGQISTAHLKSKLSTGCHILVATPGRLKDFVGRGWIGFKNIKYVILDEGDRLVDEGFSTDIRSFFNDPSMPPNDKRQTLFFSATFKESTQLNAREYMKDKFIFLTVGRVGAANEDIKQEFLVVSRQDKKRELKKILLTVPEGDKTIIFTQTKNAADILAGFFTALELSSTSIHGDRHQSQREQAIKAFKRGEKRFLISSPVGNRGLDLPKVSLVINYDLPNNIDEYVHRIGRTGRAGHTGRAISFYDEERDREILPELISILTEAKQEIPEWMSGGGGAGAPSTGGEDWGNSGTNASNDIPAGQNDNPDAANNEPVEEFW